MATPKKKTSRARRDKRRYSAAHALREVSWVNSTITGDPIRPHTVTLESLDAYVAARQESKKASAKASAAKKA